MKLTTRRIAFAGILAAVYAALTIATSSFAYGPVQFRVAEAFAVLCCFTPAAIPGMVVGCMAANLASFVSAWDFAIGSVATLLACVVTWLMSRPLRLAQTEKLTRRTLGLVLLVPHCRRGDCRLFRRPGILAGLRRERAVCRRRRGCRPVRTWRAAAALAAERHAHQPPTARDLIEYEKQEPIRGHGSALACEKTDMLTFSAACRKSDPRLNQRTVP